MGKREHSNYSVIIAQRISLILEHSGLTIKGLEELTQVSESHIYALINGNKRITEDIASKLSSPFNFTSAQLLNLDYQIGENIKKSTELIRFKKLYKDNNEYFSTTKNNAKPSYYIENIFLKNPIFDKSVYLWEIIEVLKSEGKNYNNKDLSKILHYLVIKGKLISERKPIKLKNGKYGNRMVYVFFRK